MNVIPRYYYKLAKDNEKKHNRYKLNHVHPRPGHNPSPTPVPTSFFMLRNFSFALKSPQIQVRIASESA